MTESRGRWWVLLECFAIGAVVVLYAIDQWENRRSVKRRKGAVLLGAELNSEIEHQTSRDSTVGNDKPLGARGAVKADTIGAAQV
jgi:hypothetical protein